MKIEYKSETEIRSEETLLHRASFDALTGIFNRQFANIIIENKRTEDIFARYGGEEFIILPRGEISKEDMRVQCERIRKAVENFEFRYDEACVRLTVSLGFHIQKISGSDIESMLKDLIRDADQALYLAKEKGRDRTESLL